MLLQVTYLHLRGARRRWGLTGTVFGPFGVVLQPPHLPFLVAMRSSPVAIDGLGPSP